jgi:hypothetical protein
VRAIYEVDAQARGAMKTYQVKEPLLSELKGAVSHDSYFPHPAFIEGYAAIKERDYTKAAAALQSVYQSDKPAEPAYAGAKGQWVLLPYFALAAAKNGEDAVALDQRLRAEDVGSASQKHGTGSAHAVPEFHHHLVLAIGHAFKGNHAQAKAEVKRAQATIESGGLLEARYAFVEILERLSEETRQSAYLDIALEYTRAYQRLEPWTSWAYAFEARHAPAGPARVRAAGIALKLDLQSQWLREIDQQTLQQARRWAGANRWPGKDSRSTRSRSNQAGGAIDFLPSKGGWDRIVMTYECGPHPHPNPPLEGPLKGRGCISGARTLRD